MYIPLLIKNCQYTNGKKQQHNLTKVLGRWGGGGISLVTVAECLLPLLTMIWNMYMKKTKMKQVLRRRQAPPPPLLNLKNNKTLDQHYHNLPQCATAIGVYFIFIGMPTRKKIMTYKKNEKIKCYKSKFKVQHMGQSLFSPLGFGTTQSS